MSGDYLGDDGGNVKGHPMCRIEKIDFLKTEIASICIVECVDEVIF